MIQRRGGAVRAAVAVVIVGCVVAGVGVAGAAEQRADTEIGVDPTTDQWATRSAAIETGDTVTWDMSGNGRPHNVKGAAGPAEDPTWTSFRLNPPSNTGRISRTFYNPGTYEFICEVHGGMTGELIVTGPVRTPTPTPSQTATASPTPPPADDDPPVTVPTASPTPRAAAVATPDRTTPAPTGSAGLDRIVPTLSKLKLKAVTHGARVSFALSEPAAVTIRVKHGKSTVRTVRLSARAGTRTVTVRGSKIVRGRYVVEIEARDAGGNRAAVQRKNVKVTR
jgi:plastocyanin